MGLARDNETTTLAPQVRARDALRGQPHRAALSLIRGMWADFMLGDPRMTNSMFVEGYAVSGALRYSDLVAADPQLSLAHGWSTDPTGRLTVSAVVLSVYLC